MGGDLGGPVIQDLALRHPEWVERMVVFNSPLPYDKERMAGLRSRPAREASDYFVRQGTDPDGLAAELDTPEQRRRYIATFYTSRFWAHPGAFIDPTEPPGRFGGSAVVDFHTEPFASAASLRASFGGYESVFDPAARSEAPLLDRNDHTPTLVLFGPSDHVLYPDFDRMAAAVLRSSRGPVPAARLRSLRAVGGAARPRQRHADDGRRPPRGAPIGPGVKGLISRW